MEPHQTVLGRREKFKYQIRRTANHQYFCKRRAEMQEKQDQYIFRQNHPQSVFKLMKEVNLDDWISPFRKIYALDGHGRILYLMTDWLLTPMHPFFNLIIGGMHFQHKMQVERQEEFFEDMRGIKQIALNQKELDEMEIIWEEYLKWQNQKSSQILEKVKEMRRTAITEEMRSQQVCLWIGLLVNYLLLGDKVRESLRSSRYQKVKPFQDRTQRLSNACSNFQPMMLTICTNILLNLLAEEDGLIMHLLPIITQIIGKHILLFDLYYNIFLIKNIQHELKIKMITNYVETLENNQEEFLSCHDNHIYVLYFAYQNSSFRQQSHQYLSFEKISCRLIRLLNRLLRVVNARYQNQMSLFEEEEFPESSNNIDSMYHLCKTLQKLSEFQSLAEQVVKQKYIARMMSNHLTQFNQIALSVLSCVGAISFQQSCSQQLFQIEPILWIRLIKFIRISSNQQRQKKTIHGQQVYDGKNSMHISILRQVLYIFSNLSGTQQFQGKIMQQKILDNVACIWRNHVILAQQKAQVKNIVLQCQHIIINKLSILSNRFNNQGFERDDDSEAISSFAELLSIQGIPQIFISMLKLEPKSKQHFSACMCQFLLIFIDIYLNIDTDKKAYQVVKSFFCDPSLQQCLTAVLEGSMLVSVQQKSQLLLKRLKKIKKQDQRAKRNRQN